ncbi:MAG: hypothetical protein GY793_08165 [Proteobacteria bacterium]|nr:hypothetical protein [Pseudomonadota bacterium]
MRILGIETSCDETAGSVLDVDNEKVSALSHIVGSQIEIHKQYGGVVPEVAARTHMQNIIPIVDEALAQAGTNINEIDLVAVTQGPGLMTSLMVGLEFGKTLSFTKNIPFVSVNHLAGHVFSWALPKVGESEEIDKKNYLALSVDPNLRLV